MVEIVAAVAIIGLAILPMLSTLTSTNRAAYSVGIHMVASELGSNVLERLLAIPFEDCVTEIGKLGGKIEGREEMEKALDSFPTLSSGKEMKEDFSRLFRTLKYEVKTSPAKVTPDLDQFLISVIVSFDYSPGATQKITFRSLKFKEGGR